MSVVPDRGMPTMNTGILLAGHRRSGRGPRGALQLLSGEARDEVIVEPNHSRPIEPHGTSSELVRCLIISHCLRVFAEASNAFPSPK